MATKFFSTFPTRKRVLSHAKKGTSPRENKYFPTWVTIPWGSTYFRVGKNPEA